MADGNAHAEVAEVELRAAGYRAKVSCGGRESGVLCALYSVRAPSRTEGRPRNSRRAEARVRCVSSGQLSCGVGYAYGTVLYVRLLLSHSVYHKMNAKK